MSLTCCINLDIQNVVNIIPVDITTIWISDACRYKKTKDTLNRY